MVLHDDEAERRLPVVPAKSVLYWLLPWTCSVMIGAALYCFQRWMCVPLTGPEKQTLEAFASLSSRRNVNLFTRERWGHLAICCAVGAFLFGLVAFLHYREYRQRFERWQEGLPEAQRDLVEALIQTDSIPQSEWYLLR